MELNVSRKEIVPFQKMVEELQKFEEFVKSGKALTLPPHLVMLVLCHAAMDLETRYWAMVELVKIAKEGIEDELTGLFNRRFFFAQLRIMLIEARRLLKPMSVILFDIDRFKKINDQYGHLKGDIVLKTIANLIPNCVLRRTDIVARFGGDEFGMVLPLTSLEIGLRLAERIRKIIEAEELILSQDEPPVDLGISAGVACFSPIDKHDKISVTKIYEQADLALYWAKEGKGNQVREFKPGMLMPARQI